VHLSAENGPYLGIVRDMPRLLLITNRKWHIGFQMTWKLLTFDDPEGQYVLLGLNGAR